MAYIYDVAIDEAFRKVNDWCVRNGHAAGFPNFHMRDPDGVTDKRVYGVIILPGHAVEWKDVLARDLGNPNPSDHRVRMTTAHGYARRQRYAHGYPNFHQANYGNGVVYGTFFIKEGSIHTYRDVLTRDLGLGSHPSWDPRTVTLDHWFRKVNDYAVNNGFDTGKPNGNWGQHASGEWVIGVHLFSRGNAPSRDVTWGELGYPRPPGPGPTSGKTSVGFFRPNSNQPFDYQAFGLPSGAPPDSRIDRVTNMALDVNNQVSIPLTLSFVDRDGRRAGPINLQPRQTVTGDLRGLLTDGTWTARVGGIVSAALLRPTFNIELDWTKQ